MNSPPKKSPDANPFKPQLKRLTAPVHQVKTQAIQPKQAARQNVNVRPAVVGRAQINQNSVQPKSALTTSSRQHPAAPPVYRPQQTPRAAQMKTAQGQPPAAVNQTRRTPTAPPVYRPQPQKIVQPKVADKTQQPSVNHLNRPFKTPVVNPPRLAPPFSKNAALANKPSTVQAAPQRSGSQPAHVIQRSQDNTNITQYIQTKDSNCWAACLSYAIKLKHNINVDQKTVTNWLPQEYSKQGFDLYNDEQAIGLVNKKLEQATIGLGQSVGVNSGERLSATTSMKKDLVSGFTIRTPVSQVELLKGALQRHGVLIIHVFGYHFVVAHNYDPSTQTLTVYDPNNNNVDDLSVSDFCKNYTPNYSVTV